MWAKWMTERKSTFTFRSPVIDLCAAGLIHAFTRRSLALEPSAERRSLCICGAWLGKLCLYFMPFAVPFLCENVLQLAEPVRMDPVGVTWSRPPPLYGPEVARFRLMCLPIVVKALDHSHCYSVVHPLSNWVLNYSYQQVQNHNLSLQSCTPVCLFLFPPLSMMPPCILGSEGLSWDTAMKENEISLLHPVDHGS